MNPKKWIGKLRCKFGRHVWRAKAVREGSKIMILAECTRCNRWIASTCYEHQEHAPMMPSNWFPVSSSLMVELWTRAVVLNEVEIRSKP